MARVLGVVYRVIAMHFVRKAGFAGNDAGTGAVTLIRRLGSALNLNLHLPMFFWTTCMSSGPMAGFAFAGSRRR